mgnify:CR=1 FL=1
MILILNFIQLLRYSVYIPAYRLSIKFCSVKKRIWKRRENFPNKKPFIFLQIERRNFERAFVVYIDFLSSYCRLHASRFTHFCSDSRLICVLFYSHSHTLNTTTCQTISPSSPPFCGTLFKVAFSIS